MFSSNGSGELGRRMVRVRRRALVRCLGLGSLRTSLRQDHQFVFEHPPLISPRPGSWGWLASPGAGSCVPGTTHVLLAAWVPSLAAARSGLGCACCNAASSRVACLPLMRGGGVCAALARPCLGVEGRCPCLAECAVRLREHGMPTTPLNRGCGWRVGMRN